MAQKRKIEVSITSFDGNKPDVDISFQNAANEVSKLYHQAMKFQQSAFDAGRRHSLVKAFEWVSSKAQDGKLVTSSELMAYLQHELNDSLATGRQMFQEEQMEVDLSSSCPTASIRRQEPGESVPFSQDLDMEESSPHV